MSSVCSVWNVDTLMLHPDVPVTEYRETLEIAATLGARTINALNLFPPDSTAAAAERLAAFAALAAQAGLEIVIEWFRFSGTTTLGDAIHLVREAAQPEIGLNVDILHLIRNAGDPTDLTAVDPALIRYAQICDGPVEVPASAQLDEAVLNREFPGEGAFPLISFVQHLPRDTVLSIEAPVNRLRDSLDARQRAARAVAGTRRILAAAGCSELRRSGCPAVPMQRKKDNINQCITCVRWLVLEPTGACRWRLASRTHPLGWLRFRVSTCTGSGRNDRGTLMATIESKVSEQTTEREDFLLPKDLYLSPQIAKLEKERLWPKVWQMVGRVEQLRGVGSYLTYDIGDDAVIVVRTSENTLKAFHNVCQHRGRRLLDAEGNVSEIACRFHGWRWHLNGKIKSVTERSDWDGCKHMADGDIALKTVHVDTWAGWIFINLDEKAESLAKFIKPVADRCAPYEFEKLRTRWNKTVTVKCNWKVAVEAFNEFYHVTATHAQLQRYQDDVSRCYLFGDHGMMSYPPELNRLWGSPAARTGMPVPKDYRAAIVAGVEEFERTLKAIWSPRAVAATHRLMTELPADATPEVALTKMVEFWREAAIAEGAGWPDITLQQAADAGYDWHVFPNFLFLMGPDAAIFYRVRPNGDDHESCIFDIWSMVRYVPGGEPQVEHEVYARWQDCDSLGLILMQDFTNMEHVQHGMKSRGFNASRANPLQETVLINFHRAIRDYLAVGT